MFHVRITNMMQLLGGLYMTIMNMVWLLCVIYILFMPLLSYYKQFYLLIKYTHMFG